MTNEELNGLEEERERLIAEVMERRGRIKTIEAQVESAKRAQLQSLVGTAVKCCGPIESGSRWDWLNGAIGTLVKVKRTRCEIDFDDQLVGMPILHVAPCEDELAAEIPLECPEDYPFP